MRGELHLIAYIQQILCRVRGLKKMFLKSSDRNYCIGIPTFEASIQFEVI